MTNHKKQRNIGLFYIVVLALCTISNVQSKIFNEKIKKILASRNYDDVLLMQQQVDSLKEAFKSKFKIGTSVSPN
jgi:macrodomain Ter protein organizer (MatP/YcbG family)